MTIVFQSPPTRARDTAPNARRPRILFISNSLPWPPNSGMYQRTMFLHKALQEVGELDMLLMRRPVRPRFEQLLRDEWRLKEIVEPTKRGEFGPWRHVRPLAPQTVDRLAVALGSRRQEYLPNPPVERAFKQLHEQQPYDLVVARYIRSAASVAWAAPRLIIDIDDIDTVRLESWRDRPGVSPLTRWVLSRHLYQVRQALPAILSRTDHAWVPGPDDTKRIDHPSISVLPNLPYRSAMGEDVRLPPPEPNCKTMVFVGVACNRMNVQGMQRFVRRCWPRIIRAVPDARLRIAGGGDWNAAMPELKRAPNVDVVGQVEQLEEAYRSAAFAVCPLYEGAGSKIKVLESLSMRRTVVLARPSLRCYEHLLHDHDSLIVADNDDQLVAGCCELLRSPSLRDRLAEHGCRIVREHYTYERFAQAVRRSVHAVLQQDQRSPTRSLAVT